MRLKVHQSAVASVIIVIKNCPHVVQSRAVPFLGLTLKFSRSGLYFICGDVFIHSSIIEKLQFLTNLKKMRFAVCLVLYVCAKISRLAELILIRFSA